MTAAVVGSLAASDPSATVVKCYSMLDLAVECGVEDFTEGIYLAEDRVNDAAAYERAQQRQAEYLLDQVRCDPDARVLDIGCGNGRLLCAAAARGAEAVGITISPQQVARRRRRRLDARLADYHRLNSSWDGRFTGLIANGSLEHFVQVEQAAADRDAPWLARDRAATLEMLGCLLWHQSWNWQFRGEEPPMRLLRQTWEAR